VVGGDHTSAVWRPAASRSATLEPVLANATRSNLEPNDLEVQSPVMGEEEEEVKERIERTERTGKEERNRENKRDGSNIQRTEQ